jgi:ATP-binding cassette subfamily C protein LapB
MLKKRAGSLVQLAVAAVASNALLILVPIFSMAVFDRVIPHLAYETLWALTIGILIALAADLALRHVKIRLIDSVAADISHVVQVRFFRRMVYGQMRGLPRKGGALAQTVRDLESYSQLIPMLFISAAVDLPFVAITSIILYDVAGTVALVPFIGGLITCFVFALAHMSGRARLAPYLGLMATQSNSVIETIEGLETVKTATAETALLNKWERLADATSLGSHMSRLSLMLAQQWLMSISQVMTVATLVLGVYEISQNAMTVGALSASTMLVGRLIGPISQFIVQAQRVAQAKKTLEPIRAVLNTPIERAGDGGFTINRKVTAQIDVLNVSYSYPQAHAPSLSGASLAIRPGERIGIIGRVGSGKSTLLRLLVRLLDPSEGAIRLDGSDIRQFSPREIRRQFAYMKQDTSLFDDTLKANIFFGLDYADPALAEEALAISGVGAFAGRSPEGFGMRVGPRGERLSGGERQAVGLARAMIGNPTLLLLDEPTASMDNTTERQIIIGLSQWLKGRTLIVATHRAAMLDLVDRVILMHEGKIIADGPKDQVLKKLQSG